MKNIFEHKNEDGHLVFRFNKRTKRGEYFILEGDRQSNAINNPIKLEGFILLPSGFYKEGYGLTSGGNLAIQEIHDRLKKKIDLSIVQSGHSRIDARGKNVKLTFSHKELTKLNGAIRNIKRERNEDMRIEVLNFLGATFNQFKDLKDSEAGYVPGRLAELLEQKGLVQNLSSEDRESLEEFIPDYLANIPGTLRAKKSYRLYMKHWMQARRFT